MSLTSNIDILNLQNWRLAREKMLRSADVKYFVIGKDEKNSWDLDFAEDPKNHEIHEIYFPQNLVSCIVLKKDCFHYGSLLMMMKWRKTIRWRLTQNEMKGSFETFLIVFFSSVPSSLYIYSDKKQNDFIAIYISIKH